MDTSDMSADVAIIGGVGFSAFSDSCKRTVNTPYGTVRVYFSDVDGRTVAMIPRHYRSGEHTPPHLINYRANIWAARDIGASRLISTNSVGSMKGHAIGSFFLPDDFIDFTSSRVSTFFDKNTVHVDMTEPYCGQTRDCLVSALQNKGVGFSEGTYACTEGPRFETRAEIAMMSMFADVVGMTGVPEVILARELELCYASICTVTNHACGIGDEKLTADEVVEELAVKRDTLLEIISETILHLPDKRDCECGSAIMGARL
ncbi:MAG: MTAP family purine nucleoside phosphorylase [Euryarchaeota archaeon]|nr:MTAP family purine nucleoside phosphorylase [Euryarchaeota archaeon]